jgi:hypothetical protein
LSALVEEGPRCFSPTTRASKSEDFEEIRNNPGRRRTFEQGFDQNVRHFFEGELTINDLLDRFLVDHEVIILEVHQTSNERHQEFVMHEIFYRLKKRVEYNFRRTGATVNAQILLDEGPRWVPEFKENPTSELIRDAFNTTRKYGLGWTIVTQSMADISKTVVKQAHDHYFGRGLGIGADKVHLINSLGEEGFRTYVKLNQQGGYFWVGRGTQVNLGIGNTFATCKSFEGNATNAIIEANPHIWARSPF